VEAKLDLRGMLTEVDSASVGENSIDKKIKTAFSDALWGAEIRSA
jgi:hypothetical protein